MVPPMQQVVPPVMSQLTLFEVTCLLQVLEHPFALVAVTVYVPELTLMQREVAPLLH